MFSILNTPFCRGKTSARMCKILNSLSTDFHGFRRRFLQGFYLVEPERFRDEVFAAVGHRIALLVRQPVPIRIRSGKD